MDLQHFRMNQHIICSLKENLLCLQAVKSLVEHFIVPLIDGQIVCGVNDGEGVDQVCAQLGINISRHVLPTTRPVLGPVCEVAYELRS